MLLNCGVGEDSWESLEEQGDQTSPSWEINLLVGRTDAEAETPVFWSSNGNSWLIGKVPDAGEDWGQKEKGTTEDEMAGWHHRCNGHELGQTSEDGEGQRDLMCCSPWGRKESDTTGWLDSSNCLHTCSLQLMGVKGAWGHWRLTGRGFLLQGVSSSRLHLASAVLLVSVQSLRHVRLFATPWIAAHHAYLSITNSQSLLKLMSIESVMPSSHLILCRPLLLPPSIFPSIRVFPMSQLFTSGGQSNGVSASASVLPMNIQDCFPLGWTGWISLQSKELSRVFSNHRSKTSILWRSAFFIVQLSHPYMTTGKTLALTRWTFVGKVMSLLFNMLSRLDIAFLPRSKRLLISWLQSPSAVRCSELLYYRADCNPVILLLKLFQIWALGAPSKLFLLTCPLTLWVHSYLGGTAICPCISCGFPAQPSNWLFLPGALGSSIGEYLDVKIWLLAVFMLLLLGPRLTKRLSRLGCPIKSKFPINNKYFKKYKYIIYLNSNHCCLVLYLATLIYLFIRVRTHMDLDLNLLFLINAVGFILFFLSFVTFLSETWLPSSSVCIYLFVQLQNAWI